MAARNLLVLVSIFSELLLAFVGRNLLQFAFSSAGHIKLLGLTAIEWILFFSAGITWEVITKNPKMVKGSSGPARPVVF